eukprot:1858079-Alexandrium_andersonii.AAC.1
MSASLVGSEMCIRDRANAMGSSAFRIQRFSIKACAFATKSCPHPVSTVSYTHLTLPTICSV